MASKTRLANKTIWALEDIIATCIQARRVLRRAVDHSAQTMDYRTLAVLASVVDCVAHIEHRTIDARHGDYHEFDQPVTNTYNGHT